MDIQATPGSLRSALVRSSQLAALIRGAWDDYPPSEGPRPQSVRGLCAVSINHGGAVQAVLQTFPASAISLVRPQYESLVRAVWVTHAASDSDLARLIAPLSPESQQAAKKLPGVSEMLDIIEKTGPRGAAALLGRARKRMGDGLNSFVHGGIHPFARQRDGYPTALLMDILRNSNGLSMLSLVVLAELVQNPEVVQVLRQLSESFAEVLPTLEPL